MELREIKSNDMEMSMGRPHISFSVDDLPEATGWVPGEEYLLVIKAKMTDLRENSSSFEVCGVGLGEEDEWEEEEEKTEEVEVD